MKFNIELFDSVADENGDIQIVGYIRFEKEGQLYQSSTVGPGRFNPNNLLRRLQHTQAVTSRMGEMLGLTCTDAVINSELIIGDQ